MKIARVHSHLNGLEFLEARRPKLWREVKSVIGAVDASICRTKESREERMKGKLLYCPKSLNRAFETSFAEHGWSSERASYYVCADADVNRRVVDLEPAQQKKMIEAAGLPAHASFNQTDFVKQRVAVEVQLGKYAFVAYDLFVKHLAFYVRGLIDVGIEIIPMKSLQAEMSSGPAYYEGELYNLVREGRGVPPVPLVLIGVEA